MGKKLVPNSNVKYSKRFSFVNKNLHFCLLLNIIVQKGSTKTTFLRSFR
jgi:hypothetical protein